MLPLEDSFLDPLQDFIQALRGDTSSLIFFGSITLLGITIFFVIFYKMKH